MNDISQYYIDLHIKQFNKKLVEILDNNLFSHPIETKARIQAEFNTWLKSIKLFKTIESLSKENTQLKFKHSLHTEKLTKILIDIINDDLQYVFWTFDYKNGLPVETTNEKDMITFCKENGYTIYFKGTKHEVLPHE